MLEKRPARVPIQTGETCSLARATSTAAAPPAREAMAEYRSTSVGMREVSGPTPVTRAAIILRTTPAMIAARKPATNPKYKLCGNIEPSAHPARAPTAVTTNINTNNIAVFIETLPSHHNSLQLLS